MRSYGINLELLDQKVQNYSAGNIQHFSNAWRKLTSDKHILGIVQHGLQLNFLGDPPEKDAFEYPRSSKEFDLIDSEVQSLIKKAVVSESSPEQGEYFSNLFTTPKKGWYI